MLTEARRNPRSKALSNRPPVGQNGAVGRRTNSMTAPSKRSLRSIALLGFLAALLVVVGGSLAGAAAPGEAGRLWSVPTIPVTPRIDIVPALIAYYGGLIILVRAWLLLRRYHLTSGLSVWAVAMVVLIWAGPLLIGPPLGSRDVYAYAAQGRLAEQGFDVYNEGPAQLGADDPVLAAVDPLYHESPVLYGPVFVSMSSGGSAVVGDRLVAAVMAFRTMAVVGLLAAAVAVYDLARSFKRDPVDALVLAVANPLVLFHLISGAHNEAIMLGFLVTGVAIARRREWFFLGIGLCAFAAAIKLPAILAVAFVGWPWSLEGRTLARKLGRLVSVGAVALLVIAAAGRLTGWGWGWVDAITNSRPVDAYLSITRVLGGGVSVVTGLDGGAVLSAARLTGLLLAIAISGLLLLRRHNRWPAALAWSLLFWAVLHPTTQPWYLTWGLMLLAATTAGERNRALVTGCAVAMFAVLPIGPQLGLVVLDNTGRLTLVAACLLLTVLTFSPARRSAGFRRADLDPNLVSVVVPIRHEAPNVGPFVDNVVAMHTGGGLDDRRIEVLFVDDSDDETPDVVKQLVADHNATETDVAVRLVHRPAPSRWGGLGGAVADGFEAAGGSVAVVMDGDLQHPASTIPDLVGLIDDGADIAAASRRVAGGSDGQGLTPMRHRLSVGASAVARWLFPGPIGRVQDPLSGFFAVRLGALDLSLLQPDGFKILIELLATHPRLTVVETPFRFVGRTQGMSKASASEGARYLGHLVDLRIRTSRVWAGAPVPQRAFHPVTSDV
ncbi:MAG: polyprenol phosphomannose-dependent alpha 1,6 mannosyltransferase MptB [Actinomycetota bacterium]